MLCDVCTITPLKSEFAGFGLFAQRATNPWSRHADNEIHSAQIIIHELLKKKMPLGYHNGTFPYVSAPSQPAKNMHLCQKETSKLGVHLRREGGNLCEEFELNCEPIFQAKKSGEGAYCVPVCAKAASSCVANESFCDIFWCPVGIFFPCICQFNVFVHAFPLCLTDNIQEEFSGVWENWDASQEGKPSSRILNQTIYPIFQPKTFGEGASLVFGKSQCLKMFTKVLTWHSRLNVLCLNGRFAFPKFVSSVSWPEFCALTFCVGFVEKACDLSILWEFWGKINWCSQQVVKKFFASCWGFAQVRDENRARENKCQHRGQTLLFTAFFVWVNHQCLSIANKYALSA